MAYINKLHSVRNKQKLNTSTNNNNNNITINCIVIVIIDVFVVLISQSVKYNNNNNYYYYYCFCYYYYWQNEVYNQTILLHCIPQCSVFDLTFLCSKRTMISTRNCKKNGLKI